MTDREKVIASLDTALVQMHGCGRYTPEDVDELETAAWKALELLKEMPTVGGWISVKDETPDEHDSIFAKHPFMSKHMWEKESDDVIVYVRFPDGSGRSTEGRLRDGKWHTKISPSLEPVVTHWRPMPEPPTGDKS